MTTFDEVPPFFVGRSQQAACDSHRGQRWCNLCKTCTAEVFVRPRTLKTEVSKYSRPARTPPSTFLFLHLHLSNSPGPENPNSPWRGGPQNSHSTANDNRLGSAVFHSSS